MSDPSPTLHTMLPAYTAAEYWEKLDPATREAILVKVTDCFQHEARLGATLQFALLPPVVKAYVYESPEFRQYTAEHFKAPKVPKITDGKVQ